MGDYEQRKPVATPKPSAAGSPAPLPKRRDGAKSKSDRKPKPIETEGHREASWVKPNPSGGTQLVGRIYFRTKQSQFDFDDIGLLRQLAGAYARGHNSAPIEGTAEGFADPRPSHDPGNGELASARARTVAHELDHAFRRTRPPSGYAGVAAHGRGVDPAAKSMLDDGPAAEGNALAPFRRVDIYLTGKADPNGPVHPQHVAVPKKPPPAPDYGNRHHGLDDYEDGVQRGDIDAIQSVARRVFGNVNAGADAVLFDILMYSGVKYVKPPWWDARDRAPAPRVGRGGPKRKAPRERLVERAEQLRKDYRRYTYYLEERQPDLSLWLNDPDHSRTPERAMRLGHLVFMIVEMRAESEAVERMTEQ